MTIVLSQEELVELTDYRRPADQRRWLSERGIPYDVGAKGCPKVLRSVYEKIKMGEIRGSTGSAPNWSAVR